MILTIYTQTFHSSRSLGSPQRQADSRITSGNTSNFLWRLMPLVQALCSSSERICQFFSQPSSDQLISWFCTQRTCNNDLINPLYIVLPQKWDIYYESSTKSKNSEIIFIHLSIPLCIVSVVINDQCVTMYTCIIMKIIVPDLSSMFNQIIFHWNSQWEILHCTYKLLTSNCGWFPSDSQGTFPELQSWCLDILSSWRLHHPSIFPAAGSLLSDISLSFTRIQKIKKA